MVTVPRELCQRTGAVHYKNVDDLIGFLIERKVATLHELKTVYTSEDALNMQEALLVPMINQWYEMEREKMRRKYKV